VELSLRLRVGDLSSEFSNILEKQGFVRISRMGTYIIPLAQQSDEMLLSGFKKGTRRDVRRAEREGLQVGATLKPEQFAAFEDVQCKLTEAKGFQRLPKSIATGTLLTLARQGLGALFVAEFEGQARNYAYVSSVGQPVYLWGALGDSARALRCPETGQLLQYQIMRYYREQGCRYYDLGGAPGQQPDPHHCNYNVWKFKSGFGGQYVMFVGTWRRILRPARTALLDKLRYAAHLLRYNHATLSRLLNRRESLSKVQQHH
jgi:lipid II:glycine glycyltransferase (peptidoglycan interpeptide bridge formation enzyme)